MTLISMWFNLKIKYLITIAAVKFPMKLNIWVSQGHFKSLAVCDYFFICIRDFFPPWLDTYDKREGTVPSNLDNPQNVLFSIHIK